jgi:hypothetical protein
MERRRPAHLLQRTNWETENVILPSLELMEQYGSGACSHISAWLPGDAGHALGIACSILYGAGFPLFRAWVKYANNLGGQRGIWVQIWYFKVWWW